ncbi:MAG: hypothetical protein WB662_12535, partial [Methyloceanibacter sp.]
RNQDFIVDFSQADAVCEETRFGEYREGVRSDAGALNLGLLEVCMRTLLARGFAFALVSLAITPPLGHGADAAEAGEVNVYSYRQPYLIDPLFKEFTEKTGIKARA